MLKVTIREKDEDERRMVFESDAVVIGRSKAVDVVLPRNNISKRHARLIFRDDRIVLVDLRSTNGTYVNGQRISAPEVIAETDKIYIGDFVLNVVGEKLDPLATTKRSTAEKPSSTLAMEQLTVDQLTTEESAPPTLKKHDASDGDDTEGDGNAGGDDLDGSENNTLEEEFDFEIDWSQGPLAPSNDTEDEEAEGNVTQVTTAFADDELADESPEPDPSPIFAMGDSDMSAEPPSQTAIFAGVNNAEPDDDDTIKAEPSADETGESIEEPVEVDEPTPTIPPEVSDPLAEAAIEASTDLAQDEPEPFDSSEPQDTEPELELGQEQIIEDVVIEETHGDGSETEPMDELASMEQEVVAVAEPPALEEVEQVEQSPEATDFSNPLDVFLNDPSLSQAIIAPHGAVLMRGRLAETLPVSTLDESMARLLGELGYQNEIAPSMICGTLNTTIQTTLIQPPMASNGPIILLRRETSQPQDADAVFSAFGLGAKEIDMLREAFTSRKNILLIADSIDARTSFANALASLTEDNERVVVVEDSADTQLAHPQLVRLNMDALEQAGENLSDLLPRLNADRVILNTCTSESMLSMVNLALDGQDGIIGTARGRSAEKALRRISVQLGLWSGALSRDVAGTAIAETMDYVIVLKSDHDDNAQTTEIVAVDGLDPEGFSTSIIFGGG